MLSFQIPTAPCSGPQWTAHAQPPLLSSRTAFTPPALYLGSLQLGMMSEDQAGTHS